MPANNADFHGIVFKHDIHNDGARIYAEHPEHGTVGHMLLRHDGVIRNIAVNPEHQRKGIATGMYNYAIAQGFSPKHSDVRTDEGEAWAKTTKDYSPRILKATND